MAGGPYQTRRQATAYPAAERRKVWIRGALRFLALPDSLRGMWAGHGDSTAASLLQFFICEMEKLKQKDLLGFLGEGESLRVIRQSVIAEAKDIPQCPGPLLAVPASHIQPISKARQLHLRSHIQNPGTFHPLPHSASSSIRPPSPGPGTAPVSSPSGPPASGFTLQSVPYTDTAVRGILLELSPSTPLPCSEPRPMAPTCPRAKSPSPHSGHETPIASLTSYPALPPLPPCSGP